MPRKHADPELDSILAGAPPDAGAPDFADLPDSPAADADFEFDFSDTGEIEDGWYHAKVQDFSAAVSQKGNPMWVWRFHLLEINRSIETQTALTSGGRWKVVEALNAVGIKGGEGQAIAKFKKSDVVGRPCRLRIVNETYTPQGGKPRLSPKVQEFDQPDEETMALMELPD